jgi:hypothetical protein
MAFVKGQSGNPGGRPSPARQQLDALLDECFPLTKRKKLVKLLVEDATSDDYERRKEARPLLLAYTFGKPVERQEIGGVDGGLIEVAFVDYRAGIPGVASGPDEDRDAPGED